jgi:hypothetical protein
MGPVSLHQLPGTFYGCFRNTVLWFSMISAILHSLSHSQTLLQRMKGVWDALS